jgi:glycosyltransferase involved in cell wall biosynthesis
VCQKHAAKLNYHPEAGIDMAIFRPLVSILTPCWNRAEFLDRVWQALDDQTYPVIEWIVCDDGSTDDTAQKLEEFRTKSWFPVCVITASERIGKVRMDNEAVSQARGQYILWNDSDDYLLPGAIEELVSIIESVPETERDEYVGVTALCSDEAGTIISSDLPSFGQFDTTWNLLVTKHGVTEDMIYMTRADVLKSNPFPEVDFVVPESIVWNVIGEAKARIRPIVVKVNCYRAPNAISFSGVIAYPRGRAHSMATCVRCLKKYRSGLRASFWRLITFTRYSIHGELSFGQALKLWGSNSSRLAFLLMFPIAIVLVLGDRMRGIVRMTHNEFDLAESRVSVSIKSNNQFEKMQ